MSVFLIPEHGSSITQKKPAYQGNGVKLVKLCSKFLCRQNKFGLEKYGFSSK